MRIYCQLLLLAFTVSCMAAPVMNVNIIGVSPGSSYTLVAAGDGMTVEHPQWNKNESHRQRWLWGHSEEIRDNRWHSFEIRFKIDRSQPTHITVSRQRATAGEAFPYLEVRNISGSGFKIESSAWESAADLPPAVKEDGNAILIPAEASIKQVVSVPRNQECVLRGEYRFTDASSVRPPAVLLHYEHNGWKLSIEKDSGLWHALSWHGQELLTGDFSPFELELSGKAVVSAGRDTSLVNERFDAQNGTLELEYAAADWRFRETLRFGDGLPGRLSRILSFRYDGGDADMRFGAAKFHYPFAPQGEYLLAGTFFNSPDGIWSYSHNISGTGNPQNARGRLESLHQNAKIWAAHYVNAIFVQPDGGPVLFWGRNAKNEGGNTLLTRRGKFAEIVSTVNCAGWAEKGKMHSLDPLYLEVCPSPTIAEALKNDVPQFYRSTGQTAPPDRPERVYDARIFGSFFPRFQMASLSTAASSEVERIRDMGFNVFYLPPVQEGGTCYSPFNFQRIDNTAGTFEDYTGLARRLNANGIELMQDIVPHGGDATWIGERLFNLNGVSMRDRAADFNSPSWNRKMADHTRFYSRMGASAYRVDAAAGSSSPNWRRASHGSARSFHYRYRNMANPPDDPLPPGVWERYLKENGGAVPPLEYDRASMAGLHGALRMASSIRRAAREVNNGWTMLETHGYPYTREGDTCYDILMRKIPYKFGQAAPEDIARETARYLTESRSADVPGALYMRNILSNDDRIALDVCGFAISRPMQAMLYFVEGIPMAYSDGMYGNYHFFQRLNALRQQHPALRRGIPEYRAQGPLLIITRTLPDETVIGLLNFSAQPCEYTAALPDFLRNAPSMVDAMSGKAVTRRNNEAVLTVPPFGSVLLAPGTAEPHDTAQTAAPAPSLSFKDNRVETGNYTFEFDAATGLPIAITDRTGNPLSGKWQLLTDGRTGRTAHPEVAVTTAGSRVEIAAECGQASWRFLCTPEKMEITLNLPGNCRMLAPAVKLQDTAIRLGGALWEEHTSPAYAAAKIWESDFSRGVFRHPTDYALLADSRELSMDLTRPELRLSAGTAALGVAFEPGNAPYFRLYRQFSGAPGLHLLFGGSGRMTLAAGTPPLRESDSVPAWRCGAITVTDLGCDYRVENRHWQMTISRKGGLIRDFTRKTDGTALAANAEIFLLDQKNRNLLSAATDYESRITWRRTGDGLRLQIQSELRKYKYSAPSPLVCNLTFEFRDAPEATMKYEVVSGANAYPQVQAGLRLHDAQRKTVTMPTLSDAPLLPRQVLRQTISLHAENGLQQTAADITPLEQTAEPADFSALICRTALDGTLFHQACDTLAPGTALRLFFRTFPTLHNGEAVCEMRFPDPVIMRSVSPAYLPADSRWTLAVEYAGESLSAEPPLLRQSAWNADWAAAAVLPAKISVQLEYSRKDGSAASLAYSFEASGNIRNGRQSWDFTVPEDALSPIVKISAKPSPESRLLIRTIRLDPVK